MSIEAPNHIYDLLIDYASSQQPVNSLIVGQVWTVCEAGSSTGLAMTPAVASRTLPWAGTLKGKPVSEIAAWVKDWNFHKACVGMAAINAGLNRFPQPRKHITPIPTSPGQANLSVFNYFLPQLKDKKVVVIGRYPGLEAFQNELDLQVIERQSGNPADYPDSACEYLLPEADWVFITSSSLVNKTFPRLAQLAKNATTVLMGPTTPWLPELYHFGIDYLAGTDVVDRDQLFQTAGEGGGVRIFDESIRYKVLPLTAEICAPWTKSWISQTIMEKEQLKQKMEAWYERGENKRFPEYRQLEQVNTRLSRLDTCYKILWDNNPHLTEAYDAIGL